MRNAHRVFADKFRKKGDVWRKRETVLKSKFQTRNLVHNTERVKRVLLIFTAGVVCGLSLSGVCTVPSVRKEETWKTEA
jgi:ribonucleotide monophosphatase NagD (HAD superfamily)